MPHLRKRHIQEPFDKVIKFARIVGILGHRQVGKTTFLKANSNDFVTLDDETTFNQALKSPKDFVGTLKAKRSGIDECQLVPGLFPALKVKVGTSSMPGRFILSGSVRFTSRKAIRESLTGRIVNLEIYPFTLTEIENEPNSSFFLRVANAPSISNFTQALVVQDKLYQRRTKAIEKYFDFGGLPGLFHIRESNVQRTLLKDLLETILDRDLRLVYKTSMPYQQILEYCAELAQNPLQIARPTSIRAKLRIAESTQKHLLHALESVFLLRRIPTEGDYRGDLFWFEDQAEQNYLAGQKGSEDASWITLLYRNLRGQFEYRVGESAQFFHYRTRGGAVIPLAFRIPSGVLGVYPIHRMSDFDRSMKRSADSFLKTYNQSKVVFITREGNSIEIVNDRIGIFPAQMALF